MSIPKSLQEALAHQQAGRLSQAEAFYQKILQIKPDHPDALHLLGMVAQQAGRHDIAVDLIGRAIRAKPMEAMYHNNLGMALESLGEIDEAADSFRKASLLKPDYAKAYYNLGCVLQRRGKPDEAVEHFRRALSCQPDYAEAHNNLGNALKAQSEPDSAIEHYRRALALKPNYAEAHNNLGDVLRNQGNLIDAIDHCNNALSIKPDFAEAHCNLGLAFLTQGRLDEVVMHYRKALLIKPDYADAHTNLLFTYGYHSPLDPKEYLAEARNWERNCISAHDLQQARERIFQRPSLAGRMLRVGYVSGDYRKHAVSYFIEQLFAQHDRTRIELFVYSNNGTRDAVTERLQVLVDHWVPITGMNDAEVMDRIESDEIDVLIDLSGHTGHNRLGVFARRAAPVQVHYLGYFASTGLTEMDYLIGDEIITPSEMDGHFCEKVWRLPRIRASYEGKTDAPIPNWQPDQDGTVWLGSFNNLGKITPQTLELWAKVLHALPEGRLLLKNGELANADNRQRILDAMMDHGISPDRIELHDGSATRDWAAHMAYYDRLDIALDPVGAHGGYTTTCDALWMAVPVIALEGDRMAWRMAASILDAIGHFEWIARTEVEYIEKVVALARDVGQRKLLRSNQRDRMAASPLCDAKDLATSLEHAYFEMFERSLKRQNGLSQAHVAS